MWVTIVVAGDEMMMLLLLLLLLYLMFLLLLLLPFAFVVAVALLSFHKDSAYSGLAKTKSIFLRIDGFEYRGGFRGFHCFFSPLLFTNPLLRVRPLFFFCFLFSCWLTCSAMSTIA